MILLEAFNHTNPHPNSSRTHEEETYTQDLAATEGMHFRSIKLDFLIFSGKNPTGWVYKENYYFALHPFLDSQKIMMFSFNMNGYVLEWFQDVEATGSLHCWEALVHHMMTPWKPSPD